MGRPSYKFFTLVVICAALLSGCAAPEQPQELPPERTSTVSPSASTPASQPTVTLTLPAETPAPPAALEIARQALAVKLSSDPGQILLVGFALAEWADACLGVPTADEQCVQAVTPGYQAIFQVQGSRYAVHSSLDGGVVRFLPRPALAAQEALAYQLGVQPTQVQVTEAAHIVWADGCLGIQHPDQVCTQIVVPGYRVRLEAGGQSYEYHTDESGEQVLRTEVVPGDLGKVLVGWSRRSESGCDSAQISATKVAYGPCDGGLTTVELPPSRGQGVIQLSGKFAPFEAKSPSGTVSFDGGGAVTATPLQQRAIIEWAWLVYQEASAGRSGAAWGMVFGWRREGGIAGFCDEVAVYLSGEAVATSCKQPQMGHFWLSDSQLRLVFDWVDSLRSFETERSDPATTDAMTQRIAFSGAGSRPAREDEIQAMFDLAAELAARNQITPDVQAGDQARQALEVYFSALAGGDYAAAAALYGGSYEALLANNPDTEPTDHAALFEAGCKINGFVCSLTNLNVVDVAQLTGIYFRITVELQNPDGSLFSLGPCCGASEEIMPTMTQFDFRVSQVEGAYRVMDLPVYVP